MFAKKCLEAAVKIGKPIGLNGVSEAIAKPEYAAAVGLAMIASEEDGALSEAAGGKKKKKTGQRRLCLGIYTLQNGSFPAILRQKSTAGVSLAVDFYLILQKNLSLWSAFAVLKLRFFLTGKSEDEEILDVFQGRWIFCGEKDFFKTVQIPKRNRLTGCCFSF